METIGSSFDCKVTMRFVQLVAAAIEASLSFRRIERTRRVPG
jgi:hypothetical protein